MRTKHLLCATLAFLVIAWAGCLHAQDRGIDPSGFQQGASRSPRDNVVPFGVPLAPPIYFVNFLLVYFSNPATAALMPAYRVPLPQQVYTCLLENPDGCPYDQMARFFRHQADHRVSRDRNTDWPTSCQADPQWQPLAPPAYRHTDQINQPLGKEKADQLAQALGIEQDMVLTDTEYQCLMGVPPRDAARALIYACFIEFTNSKGNGIVVPFSSYGLNLNEQGNVLSLCAAHARCLEANKVFVRLPEIADECGFATKLARLIGQTPILEFIDKGGECQQTWAPSCIAETTRSDNDHR